jgi:hypothetical protein
MFVHSLRFSAEGGSGFLPEVDQETEVLKKTQQDPIPEESKLKQF